MEQPASPVQAPIASPSPATIDFASPANADYVDDLYERYQSDPASVGEDWRGFFAGFRLASGGAYVKGAGGSPNGRPAAGPTAGPAAGTADAGPHVPVAEISTLGVYDLVHTYREVGHTCSRLDPLSEQARCLHPLLELDNFGMHDGDLDKRVGAGGFLGTTDGTLRDLLAKLRATYCEAVGVEFTHIQDKEQRQWLAGGMEPVLNRPTLSSDQKQSVLFQLTAAEQFEQYLHRVYVGKKRFSVEGAEALIPLLNTVVEEAARAGGEQVICTMAHRGRLNVLAHVLNKPYETLLAEFEGTNLTPEGVEGDGDVKYHLGYANRRRVDDGDIKVSLLPNPSHLELVNPIQQGIVRCKQEWLPDEHRTKVIPLTVHGDAAFCGQGIVPETLSLSELPGYETGGTIHVIVNNQIGFTTPPKQGRFTPYATDMAKAIQAPVFHVNGDDPEAVVHVARLATQFRQQFKADVLIDLYCYRRHGHNEQDEPSFTQPLMYRKIAEHPTLRSLYAERLLAEGELGERDVDGMRQTVLERLKAARERAGVNRAREKVPTFSGVWRGMGRAGDDWSAETRVPAETLRRIVAPLSSLPEGFTVHPKLARVMNARLKAMTEGEGIDWGTGEMLALGSILLEGHGVRFTGQDVERGTFTHRHAVLHDVQTGARHVPLQYVAADQAPFTILNTMLSELAVVGFEWGFSSADPRNLVVWEAQFGDFVNGAQTIIDQVIASAESKWRYQSGLVLLLPHGYEGAGPEHSNAYLERFLSLCAEGNMQVAVPSTPAQYFHLLRRQLHRAFRKPLVLMMPKSLLRAPEASSTLREFTDEPLRLVLEDATMTGRASEGVDRVLLCSGKVYFALDATRKKTGRRDTAVVRVEQLYPFPEAEIARAVSRFRKSAEVVWVQEEPANRGAWSYMQPRLRDMFPDRLVTYVGRDAAASPATGHMEEHEREERQLLQDALRTSREPVDPSGKAGVTS